MLDTVWSVSVASCLHKLHPESHVYLFSSSNLLRIRCTTSSSFQFLPHFPVFGYSFECHILSFYQVAQLVHSFPAFGKMWGHAKLCRLLGLARFRYMTVSVQRGGQFRYMTTSVHMRSVSVHVFFVVRLRYMWSTISVHHYVDIGSLQENICLFYAEGLQMLNACLVCYVKLLMCN